MRRVNENRKKRKRLRWQAANHVCHCFDLEHSNWLALAFVAWKFHAPIFLVQLAKNFQEDFSVCGYAQELHVRVAVWLRPSCNVGVHCTVIWATRRLGDIFGDNTIIYLVSIFFVVKTGNDNRRPWLAKHCDQSTRLSKSRKQTTVKFSLTSFKVHSAWHVLKRGASGGSAPCFGLSPSWCSMHEPPSPGVYENMLLSMLKIVMLCSKYAKFPTPSAPRPRRRSSASWLSRLLTKNTRSAR